MIAFRSVPSFSRKKTLASAVGGANAYGQAGDKSRFGIFLKFSLLFELSIGSSFIIKEIM